jgi:hypothetical protein
MSKKITFFIIIFVCCAFLHTSIAQSTLDKNDLTTSSIEDLSIYPNPTSNGKLFIVSKNDFTKQVAIFNVLGKEIIAVTLHGKELNISKLKPGVYVIKVTENGFSATRKLIVK